MFGEELLLSTHNICFREEIRKKIPNILVEKSALTEPVNEVTNILHFRNKTLR